MTTRNWPLLGLDWGTSSQRGARLDAQGRALEERSFPRGILSVAPGQFAAVFDSLFGDWMTPQSVCLIAGMAGSQQGWLEAPYCACPAGFTNLAAKLAWVVPGRIAIVPGLSLEVDGVPAYLSGLVIGEEIKAQNLTAGEALVVIGAPSLSARYASALQLLGVRTTQVGNQATWAGLNSLASALQQ